MEEICYVWICARCFLLLRRKIFRSLCFHRTNTSFCYKNYKLTLEIDEYKKQYRDEIQTPLDRFLTSKIKNITALDLIFSQTMNFDPFYLIRHTFHETISFN